MSKIPSNYENAKVEFDREIEIAHSEFESELSIAQTEFASALSIARVEWERAFSIAIADAMTVTRESPNIAFADALANAIAPALERQTTALTAASERSTTARALAREHHIAALAVAREHHNAALAAASGHNNTVTFAAIRERRNTTHDSRCKLIIDRETLYNNGISPVYESSIRYFNSKINYSRYVSLFDYIFKMMRFLLG